MLAEKDYKLLYLINRLSKKEIGDLFYFLKASKNKHLADITTLIRIVSDRKDTNLDKETSFNLVYPKQKYTEKRAKQFRDLCAFASQEIEQFIRIQILDKREHIRQVFLLEGLYEHQMNKTWFQHRDKLQKKLDKSAGFNQFISETRFKLNLLTLFNPYNDSLADFNKEDLVQDSLYELEIYYLIHKARIYCELLSTQVTEQTTLELDVDSLLKSLEIYTKKSPLIYFYLTMIRLFKKPDQMVFNELDKFFFKHLDFFSGDEQNTLFLFMVNYVIRHSKNLIDELYVLLRKADKQGVLIADSYLMHVSYFNTLNLYVAKKKISEAKDFAKRYKKHLASDFKEASINLSSAMILFAEGKFQEARYKLSAETELPEEKFKVLAKSLDLKCLAEIQLDKTNFHRDKEVLTACKNFQSYINRTKFFNQVLQDRYLGMIYFVKSLHNIKPNFDKLKTELLQSEQLSGKAWLLDFIDRKAIAKSKFT